MKKITILLFSSVLMASASTLIYAGSLPERFHGKWVPYNPDEPSATDCSKGNEVRQLFVGRESIQGNAFGKCDIRKIIRISAKEITANYTCFEGSNTYLKPLSITITEEGGILPRLSIKELKQTYSSCQ